MATQRNYLILRDQTQSSAVLGCAADHQGKSQAIDFQCCIFAPLKGCIQAPNLDQERPEDRYELDPQALLTADRAAQDHGLEIVGIWHSHPDHPACPSETDHAAAWKGWSYMIFSVTPYGVTEIRSWRLADNRFVEEEIQS
jgi:proteasome lid subunit RPN8/RPN11